VITAEQVKEIVNASFDGVDKSTLGPMFRYPDPNDFTTKSVNQIAFGAFTIILTGMMRNSGGSNGDK
jgi:hypothetical protein